MAFEINTSTSEFRITENSELHSNSAQIVPHESNTSTTSPELNFAEPISTPEHLDVLNNTSNIFVGEHVSVSKDDYFTLSNTTNATAVTTGQGTIVPQHGSSKVNDILTSLFTDFDTTSSGLELNSQGDTVEVHEASNVGVAVGVTIGIVVLLAAIVLLIIFIVCRKRKQQRKKSEVVMENPQYTLERDSILPKNFDLTMHTGPMVRSQLNNNSSENGKRKKEAPRPPIYKPTAGKDASSKRKAPSPPKHLGYEDLYEKDSTAGSAEALEMSSFYAVGNSNTDPVAECDDKSSHSKPLLESFQPLKKSPNKRSSKIESIENGADQDEETTEDEQMKASLLLKEKSGSNVSLDSYDKLKNPFFS